jgi:hypothetical protein
MTRQNGKQTTTIIIIIIGNKKADIINFWLLFSFCFRAFQNRTIFFFLNNAISSGAFVGCQHEVTRPSVRLSSVRSIHLQLSVEEKILYVLNFAFEEQIKF